MGSSWRSPFVAPPGAWRRGLIAGSAWGMTTALIVIAGGAWECGGVCLPDAALTVAMSFAAGLATIGPLAAFGMRTSGQSRLSQRAAKLRASMG